MKMSELILAVGDDNIAIQNLDAAGISIDWSAKKGTKITFGSDVQVDANGTTKLGIVVWMDRDAVKKALVADKRRAINTDRDEGRDRAGDEGGNTA